MTNINIPFMEAYENISDLDIFLPGAEYTILDYRLNITDFDECVIRRLLHHHDERWCLYKKDNIYIMVNDIGESMPAVYSSCELDELCFGFAGVSWMHKQSTPVEKLDPFLTPFISLLEMTEEEFLNIINDLILSRNGNKEELEKLLERSRNAQKSDLRDSHEAAEWLKFKKEHITKEKN